MDLESLTAAFGVLTEYAVLIIDFLAFLLIMFGTAQAFISGSLAALKGAGGPALRFVWIRYSRWLVAGLTFQLAADIIESAFAPDWEDIGKLAAIALIRTFLNYFLERDIEGIRERAEERKDEERLKEI